MTIEFSKYHGAGNDFVLIDNREQKLKLSKEQIAFLCKRRFGVGADGLMLLEKSTDYDFRMKYYNADGGESTMCGNGGRCIVAFAHHLGIINNKTHFIAIDGQHHAQINKLEGKLLDISLEMNEVSEITKKQDAYFLDTGSPHHVEFIEGIDEMDVFNRGKAIRHSEQYKSIGGANVNFVEIADSFLKIRTFERGVEDETFACGTGATAAAIAYAHFFKKDTKEVNIKALGGDLRLQFDYRNDIYKDVILSGPATLVFTGKWSF